MTAARLILASASPRRRELLARVGIAFEVQAADIDETQLVDEPPRTYVARVAAGKAAAIAPAANTWVLAADTIVELDGDVLGKAADATEARAMLTRLAGRTHQVTTAFTIVGARTHAELVTTKVTMTPLTSADIDGYVASGEWRGKAGAYAIQGIGAVLIASVHGSVTNVIGLPLAEVVAALRMLDAPSAQLAVGVAS